jgi:uncharacterized membrane protein YbhN (UPF0104 family)
VIVFGAVVVLLVSLALGRLAKQRRLPVPSRLPVHVARAIESLRAGLGHVTPASLLAFAVLFFASNVAVAGILWIATRASGFEASLLFLLSAYCASHVFGTVSLMPQGLGTRDAALGILLHAGGATPEQATFAAIVVRVATTGLAFVAGMIAVSVMGLSGSARQRAVTDGSPSSCSPSSENALPGGREGIQVRR